MNSCLLKTKTYKFIKNICSILLYVHGMNFDLQSQIIQPFDDSLFKIQL